MFDNYIRGVPEWIKAIEGDEYLTLIKRDFTLTQNGQRVAPSFTSYIEAGSSVGGRCISKDLKAMLVYGKRVGVPMSLLDSVIEVNNNNYNKWLIV